MGAFVRYLCISLCIYLINAKPFANQEPQCGYDSCNNARYGALNVHIVPHSHDDVGWLKTVDQYFYGTKIATQRADVNAIITSVVAALRENPERRFIQVETAFFHKWWHIQTEATKEVVRGLVANGQLEFTGGAWSMNDEAAVHYQSIIDQFTLGLKFLNDTFGECGRPRIGWQIDPFGHSSEMASIFAQMDYDGLFFARLDWRDKMHRLSRGTAEMIWQGSRSLGHASNIFTSVLYNHYNAPVGFCFDVTCSDDPLVTDAHSTEYNIDVKLEMFKNYIIRQSGGYLTNNILITMGDDFNYQDAISYYRNLDTLINAFEVWPQHYNNRTINVFYSTPACYVKAVNEEINAKNIQLPLETHDFLPYATDYHAYWSGYYTSRPTSKRSERKCNNLLQVHKQLAAFNQAHRSDELFRMQNALGIMQHHDAITGTEKQHVADDYAKIMNEAFVDSGFKAGEHISLLLRKNPSSTVDLKWKQCLLMNATICPESNSDAFTVAVYNPLANVQRYAVRLPVNGMNFTIVGPHGEIVPYQVVPSIHTFPYKRAQTSQYELTFIVGLPPLGMQLFHVTKMNNFIREQQISTTETQIGNAQTNLTLDPTTGLISSVTINNIVQPLTQNVMVYFGARGNNSEFGYRASGAYIFRNEPGTNASITNPPSLVVRRGELFDEVHQVFHPSVKQVMRIYHDPELREWIEFDWVVGPIPIADRKGKEIISRFNSELLSGDSFYTDSNGREMLHRRRDYRPTYPFTVEEPIAGNYHPVTAQITLTDGKVRMSVLNDRAQGGTSLKSGEIELMLHRRCLDDDAFGVAEALNELEFGQGLTVRGRHYLTLTYNGAMEIVERRLAERIALEPWIFLENTNAFQTIDSNFNLEFTGLQRVIPAPVRILTLEPVPEQYGVILLRLEHYSNIGKMEVVDLNELFTNFDVISMQETNLAANVFKPSSKGLQWNQFPQSVNNANNNEGDLKVALEPMHIKTFLLYVAYKVR